MEDEMADLYDFTGAQLGGFGPAPLADFEEEEE